MSAPGSETRFKSTSRVHAHRGRLARGERRGLVVIKKHYLDRLELMGYLDPFKRGDRAAEIEAVECYLGNTLLPLD